MNTKPGFPRTAIAAAVVGVALSLASLAPATSLAAPAAVTWPHVYLNFVEDGFTDPVHITHAGDDSGRLFVVEREGIISIIKNGQKLNTPFLDLSPTGEDLVGSGGSEEGLLSVAFPPSFADDDPGHFYVFYDTKQSGGGGDNSLVIARYEADADEDEANTIGAETVLTINHPDHTNHNGGQLAFSPDDGYLYISIGDGAVSANAQNINTLLGKILRIDVETSDPVTYTIPADNPFLGVAGADEIWGYGVRNPWRFSFDRQTGDFYLGDVGEQTREEIDFVAAGDTDPQNFGWTILEGFICHQPSVNCVPPANYVPPVFDYNHSLGCAVAGGYVYRGTVYERIQGIYFYGDECTGRIWGLINDGGTWENHEFLDWDDFSVASFGEDQEGNLYVTHYSDGAVYMISADENDAFFPLSLRP